MSRPNLIRGWCLSSHGQVMRRLDTLPESYYKGGSIGGDSLASRHRIHHHQGGDKERQSSTFLTIQRKSHLIMAQRKLSMYIYHQHWHRSTNIGLAPGALASSEEASSMPSNQRTQSWKAQPYFETRASLSSQDTQTSRLSGGPLKTLTSSKMPPSKPTLSFKNAFFQDLIILYMWGSNSRAESARAKRLGWEPKRPSFWDCLAEDCRVAAE